MQILKARFHTNSEFLAAYSSEPPEGALFVPTTTPQEVGAEVVIELACDGLPNKVLVRGTVQAWRPALPRLRVRAGATVVFQPEEREKRDFILGALGGTIKAPIKRRHPRIPVQVPVTFRRTQSADVHEGELLEISNGGALLRASERMASHDSLVLAIVPPGGEAAMEIEGQITNITRNGLAGVRFSFRDGGGARRLRELIRRIRIS